MTTINYFYNNEGAVTRYLNTPQFEQLIQYFCDHADETIILRQLKKTIQTQENLDLFLDHLIENRILERIDRHYTLGFPIFTHENDYVMSEKLQQLTSIFQTVPEKTSLYLLGEWLWPFLFEKEEAFFFGITGPKEIDTFPYTKKMLETSDWCMVSITPINHVLLDLPTYFSLISSNQKLPDQFQSLEKLIGDVDTDYFMKQVQRIVRASKRTTTKRNIFKEALYLTEDMKQGKDGQVTMVTPVIESREVSFDTKLLSNIEKELRSYFSEIQNTNERIYAKLQFFSSILITRHENEFPYRYLLKK